jgi:hypothetical protein
VESDFGFEVWPFADELRDLEPAYPFYHKAQLTGSLALYACNASHCAVREQIHFPREAWVSLVERCALVVFLRVSILDQLFAVRTEVWAIERHAADGHAGGFGARCRRFAVDVGEDSGDVGAVLERDPGYDAGEEDGGVGEGYQGKGAEGRWFGHCCVCVEAVGDCLDGGGRGGEGDGYMCMGVRGDDGSQPTDGITLWGCSCGGSARERVVGATCSGVIRMAEVPRGRLGQGRFLNRLRFAEVNAERSV